jgi:uncharacterized protein (DUF983 family)
MPDNQELVTGITGPAQASEVPQFSTAEYAHIPGTERCSFCGNAISGEYYRVNTKMACSKCGADANDGQPKDSHVAFVRGILWGIGGAALGLILYSTVGIVTGFTIGYLALAVGFLVAKAMMKGSNGTGGLRYQIVAVGLTYAAISISAVPIGIAYDLKHRPPSPTRQTNSTQLDSDASGSSGDAQPTFRPKARPNLGVALVGLLLLGIASPFLELQNPAHGIIGLVILFVGLSIAFRMTAAKPLAVDGPFPVTG